MPIIPALRRLRKEDTEFKASLGYIVRSCFKNKQKKVPSRMVRRKKDFDIKDGIYVYTNTAYFK
jgi:uncharacterized protein with FMN-binding domain